MLSPKFWLAALCVCACLAFLLAPSHLYIFVLFLSAHPQLRSKWVCLLYVQRLVFLQLWVPWRHPVGFLVLKKHFGGYSVNRCQFMMRKHPVPVFDKMRSLDPVRLDNRRDDPTTVRMFSFDSAPLSKNTFFHKGVECKSCVLYCAQT